MHRIFGTNEHLPSQGGLIVEEHKEFEDYQRLNSYQNKKPLALQHVNTKGKKGKQNNVMFSKVVKGVKEIN